MYPLGHSRAFFVTCFFLLISLPFGYRISSARTWNVLVDGTGDAPTVQAGLDSAASDDTALVHAGTYTEKINFGAKNLVLLGQSGPRETFLDGSGFETPVVTINQGQNRSAKLEGFTITHGAGGVFIFDAGPEVVDNFILDNQGVGLSCIASTNTTWFPLIQGNTIVNNVSTGNGAGISTQPGVVPEILDNRISGNSAVGNGGGINCLLGSSGAVIKGNRVGDNQAYNDGGGIYVESENTAEPVNVEISWNFLRGNFARGLDFTGTGCGIDLVAVQASVHHNTIVENDGDGAHTRVVEGGGIAVFQSGAPTIEQNVIAFNKAGGGIWCDPHTSPLIRNNLAWENAGGNISECSSGGPSDGNVIDNPYFCDSTAGDFTVASNSGVMTHPAGPLGAFSTPGCGPVAVQHSTWGSLKARY